MTDFIHEHPAADEPAASPSLPDAGAEETPLDEKTGQKRVYGYIFILFIVAFALLLWSFLMNRRNTDEVLSELRGNASSLQSMLDRSAALEAQVDALETERDGLEEENETLREQLEETQTLVEKTHQAETEFYYAVFAMNYLWQLDRAVAEGNDAWVEEFITRLESVSDTPKPLKDYLPNHPLFTDPDGNDAPSPAARYAELKERLGG